MGEYIAATFTDDGREDIGEFYDEASAVDACVEHAKSVGIDALVWEPSATHRTAKYLTARPYGRVYHVFCPNNEKAADATEPKPRKRSPTSPAG